MSGPPLVLDAAGLDAVAAPRPSDRVRALLAEAHQRGIVDAHVVAVCIPSGGGLVVTSDPNDIQALAAAAPAARIRVTPA